MEVAVCFNFSKCTLLSNVPNICQNKPHVLTSVYSTVTCLFNLLRKFSRYQFYAATSISQKKRGIIIHVFARLSLFRGPRAMPRIALIIVRAF